MTGHIKSSKGPGKPRGKKIKMCCSRCENSISKIIDAESLIHYINGVISVRDKRKINYDAIKTSINSYLNKSASL